MLRKFPTALAVAAAFLLAATAAQANSIAIISTADYVTIYGDVECPVTAMIDDGVPGDGSYDWQVDTFYVPSLPDGCEIWDVVVDGLDPGEYHLSARAGYLHTDGQWRWTAAVAQPASAPMHSASVTAQAGRPTRVQARVCPVGGTCNAWVTILDSATM